MSRDSVVSILNTKRLLPLNPASIQARPDGDEDGEKRRSLEIRHIRDFPGCEKAMRCEVRTTSQSEQNFFADDQFGIVQSTPIESNCWSGED